MKLHNIFMRMKKNRAGKFQKELLFLMDIIEIQ